MHATGSAHLTLLALITLTILGATEETTIEIFTRLGNLKYR
jgi:hypothetical protein